MTDQHWLAVNPDTGEIITDNATKRVIVTHQEIFEALAECCDMLPALKPDGKRDWSSMTRTERGMLNRVSKELREAGRSVDDVLGFREWFRLNDWRGKRGDPPLPTDVVKMFTRYMTARMPRDVDWCVSWDEQVNTPGTAAYRMRHRSDGDQSGEQ